MTVCILSVRITITVKGRPLWWLWIAREWGWAVLLLTRWWEVRQSILRMAKEEANHARN